MGKSAQEKADEFMKNANANNHAANDEVVKDQDRRDETPVIVDAEK